MTIIDTDLLTLATYQQPKVSQSVERERAAGTLRVPCIVAAEIESGRTRALLQATTGPQVLRMQELLFSTRAFLAQFPEIACDAAAATEFDRLKSIRRLRKIGTVDLQIAALALCRRARLATRNVKSFQLIPNLQIENSAG